VATYRKVPDQRKRPNHGRGSNSGLMGVKRALLAGSTSDERVRLWERTKKQGRLSPALLCDEFKTVTADAGCRTYCSSPPSW
jgi:hypothetical protein